MIVINHNIFIRLNNDKINYLQKKSTRNKENSKKKKTRSTQGSLSFLAHRHLNVSYSNFEIRNLKKIQYLYFHNNCRVRMMGLWAPR